MSSSNEEIRRNLSVVKGGQYGKARGMIERTAEELQLDRDMQEAFAAIYGEAGSVPSQGIYDIREGRRHPWRTLARRAKEAKRKGAPLATVREPFLTFLRWIERDLYHCDGDYDRAA